MLSFSRYGVLRADIDVLVNEYCQFEKDPFLWIRWNADGEERLAPPPKSYLFCGPSRNENLAKSIKYRAMTCAKPQLLIATGNRGKLREFKELFGELKLDLIGLDYFKGIVEVEETGTTFAENAALKAGGYAIQTGRVTLADDSGLEVEALEGRPGVLSARYGGPHRTFAERMSMLLDELDRRGDQPRRARFVAAIAVADETGKILQSVQGLCTGAIAREARGGGGFGYDPLFIPDGYDQTFGELPDGVKRKISHRGRAFLQIIPFLRGFYAI